MSPAPDVPSRTASDYQDPIDDTNESYQKLENSITVENETLLGSVRDTLAAPAEVQPINCPTDPGDIDDMVGDAYKNAGKCQPFEGAALGEHCTGMATSPNFDNQMGAEMGLLGLEVIAPVDDSLSPILDALNPFADVASCVNGDRAACLWAVVGLMPGGRFPRVGKALDDVIDIGKMACSFTGDTQVLMADGTRKAIKDVTVGDLVLAVDPFTGQRTARAVTAVIVHEDTVLDLITEDGSRVTATEDHGISSKLSM